MIRWIHVCSEQLSWQCVRTHSCSSIQTFDRQLLKTRWNAAVESWEYWTRSEEPTCRLGQQLQTRMASHKSEAKRETHHKRHRFHKSRTRLTPQPEDISTDFEDSVSGAWKHLFVVNCMHLPSDSVACRRRKRARARWKSSSNGVKTQFEWWICSQFGQNQATRLVIRIKTQCTGEKEWICTFVSQWLRKIQWLTIQLFSLWNLSTSQHWYFRIWIYHVERVCQQNSYTRL